MESDGGDGFVSQRVDLHARLPPVHQRLYLSALTAREAPGPFAYRASDAALDDLRRRLTSTRWPEPPAAGWGFGTDAAYLRDLVAYWLGGFDWRKQEAWLAT